MSTIKVDAIQTRSGSGEISLGTTGSQTINRTGDGTALTLQAGGTTFGTIGQDGSDLVIDGPSGHTGLRMTTSGLLPRQNSSLINNTIDLGSSGYTFNDLYLGGGLYVGGTGAANHLDDYEEGTFTATLLGETSGSGTITNGSGGTATCRYTRVGRFVYCELGLVLSNLGSISGRVVIGGFPFVAGFFGGQGAVRNQGLGGNNYDGIVFEMNQGAASGRFHFNSSTTAQRSVGTSDATNGDFVGFAIGYSI